MAKSQQSFQKKRKSTIKKTKRKIRKETSPQSTERRK